jgi:hypothetical protein
MVMDELACPSRISSGDIMCVDCCGYLSVDPDDSDMHCPTDHHEFYYPDEWLLEIYSAYPPGSDSELGSKGKRSPDDESVLEHMNQNDLRAHFNSIPTSVRFEDMPVDQIMPTYLDTKMPFWREGSMDTTRTPPDPYSMVINRRAV